MRNTYLIRGRVRANLRTWGMIVYKHQRNAPQDSCSVTYYLHDLPIACRQCTPCSFNTLHRRIDASTHPCAETRLSDATCREYGVGIPTISPTQPTYYMQIGNLGGLREYAPSTYISHCASGESFFTIHTYIHTCHGPRLVPMYLYRLGTRYVGRLVYLLGFQEEVCTNGGDLSQRTHKIPTLMAIRSLVSQQKVKTWKASSAPKASTWAPRSSWSRFRPAIPSFDSVQPRNTQ